MSAKLKIIQNQAKFTVPLYREHVTPLPDALQDLGIPKWISCLNLEGLLCGVALYICSFRFDVVVSVSLLPSFVYGILCRIFINPKAIHVCKEFYLETSDEKLSLKKRFRLSLLRFGLKHVDAVILNASSEACIYSKILSIPESQFYFIAWPSNISDPKMIFDNKGYFLSVGRSLRDWNIFYKAIKNTPYKYIVIASKENYKEFPVEENVVVMVDVNRKIYLDILRGARGVILPLKPTIRSTGQASFLEAMAYGKPVVASDVVGVRDYLCHEVNALLCAPEDEDSMKECIVRLAEDPEISERIAINGYNDILNKFNKYKYSEKMLAVINSLSKNIRG